MRPKERAEELSGFFSEIIAPGHEVDEFTRRRYRQAADHALAVGVARAEALELLGALEDAEEHWEEALRYYRSAFEVAPTPVRSLNLCVALLPSSATEALHQLQETVERAPEIFDGASDSAIWSGLVAIEVLSANGRRGAARQLLEDIIPQVTATDPHQMFWLVEGAACVGDSATSAEFAGRVLSLLGLAEWRGSGLETLRYAVVEDIVRLFDRRSQVVIFDFLRPEPQEPTLPKEIDPSYYETVAETLERFSSARTRAMSAQLRSYDDQ